MTDGNEIRELVHELCVWVKAACFQSVKASLEATLADEKSRQIYQLTDGSASSEAIRKAAKVSPNTVSELHQKCVALGLMENTEGGRRKRLFNLRDFGIKIKE